MFYPIKFGNHCAQSSLVITLIIQFWWDDVASRPLVKQEILTQISPRPHICSLAAIPLRQTALSKVCSKMSKFRIWKKTTKGELTITNLLASYTDAASNLVTLPVGITGWDHRLEEFLTVKADVPVIQSLWIWDGETLDEVTVGGMGWSTIRRMQETEVLIVGGCESGPSADVLNEPRTWMQNGSHKHTISAGSNAFGIGGSNGAEEYQYFQRLCHLFLTEMHEVLTLLQYVSFAGASS